MVHCGRADDQYKVKSGALPHSCVANIRNSEFPTKVLVKFVNHVRLASAARVRRPQSSHSAKPPSLAQHMHVYFDANDGAGWRTCLGVHFPNKTFNNHHIAFTAMTGQGAAAWQLRRARFTSLPAFQWPMFISSWRSAPSTWMRPHKARSCPNAASARERRDS
jgi:hypothetical protein